ncbi:hypothetical protein HK096_011480, partial [Nowakowskiella sp. JEL0078]
NMKDFIDSRGTDEPSPFEFSNFETGDQEFNMYSVNTDNFETPNSDGYTLSSFQTTSELHSTPSLTSPTFTPNTLLCDDLDFTCSKQPNKHSPLDVNSFLNTPILMKKFAKPAISSFLDTPIMLRNTSSNKQSLANLFSQPDFKDVAGTLDLRPINKRWESRDDIYDHN